MGAWEGVAMDYLLFYALQAGHPRNGITAVSGVAHLQGGRPAAIFYPYRHPTQYAYAIAI